MIDDPALISSEFTDNLDDIERQLDSLAAQADALDQETDASLAPAPLDQDQGQGQAMAPDDCLDDAAFMVEMAEQTVTMIWPDLAYDDKTRHRVAVKLAPVLAKRDGALPPWLEAYKEELALAWTLAVVVGMSYRQIQAAKAEQDQEDADGAEPQRQAA